jgi:hypothetical protein
VQSTGLGVVAMWLPHIAPNLQSLLEFRLDCGQPFSYVFGNIARQMLLGE